MTFGDALFYKRSYGANAILPPDMRGYTLADLERLAAEEARPHREKREAEEKAAKVARAGDSLRRALDGPPKRRTPSRLRAAFLRQLERWGTFTQAAAAIGLDARTLHRWRERDGAFAKRCQDALARRRQMLEDECMMRARTPNVRPYFYRGKQSGETRIYNDNLLLKTLHQLNANEARAVREAQPTAIAAAVAQALAPLLAKQEDASAKMSAPLGQTESDLGTLY